MSTKKSNAIQKSLSRWESKYVELKRSLSGIGHILPGSVVKRFMPCGKDYCRCANGKLYYHGPYYQWSVAVKGKRLAIRLTPEQAPLYREWTQNNREMKKVLNEMRRIATRLAARQTKTTSKRKR